MPGNFVKNPNIEALRKIKVGHIVSFNGQDEKWKLVEIKPNDEFVFEKLTESEARRELRMLERINDALSHRWVPRDKAQA